MVSLWHCGYPIKVSILHLMGFDGFESGFEVDF